MLHLKEMKILLLAGVPDFKINSLKYDLNLF